MLSDRTVEEDLKIAMTRCDAICVTQDATGQETSTDKIVQFRNGIGDFPLIIGAGLTPQNVAEKLALGDGAIVGSFFKDNYQDNGDVCPAHVAEMMDAVSYTHLSPAAASNPVPGPCCSSTRVK